MHFPVHLDDTVIGHLWGAVRPEARAAGFLPVLSALAPGPRIRAVVIWDERLREAFRAGRTPEQALEQWRQAPPHPEAGGVPAQAQLRRAADTDALVRLLNPGLPVPPRSDPPENPAGPSPESDRWSDEAFASVLVGRTYPGQTEQSVHYLPVRLGEAVIGFLWASVTDDAAGFQPLLPADAVGNRARSWWSLEFIRARTAGVPPLTALRSRVAAPEDPQGGRIDPEERERTASGLDELRGIASR